MNALFRCSVCKNVWETKEEKIKEEFKNTKIIEIKEIENTQTIPNLIPPTAFAKTNEQKLIEKGKTQNSAQTEKSNTIKTVSWLITISIIGNIIFWILYFSDISNQLESSICKILEF